MSGAAIVHGGGVAAAAARFGGVPSGWLDLSTGINPVPVALPAIAPEAWARLPDADCVMAARQAARAFYGAQVDPLPVPGTQSVIQLLPRLVAAGGQAAVVGPTYGEYAAVLGRAGISVANPADLADIAAPDLAVVVNPNNPDGRHHRRADLIALADRLGRTGGVLVVDEAFADANGEESLAAEAGGRPNLVVLRSFGKFFGLAGLRLGFVIAARDLMATFAQGLGPWAVSGPALAIAASVMSDAAAIDRVRRLIAKRGAATEGVIVGAGLEVCGRTSLFFLVCDQAASTLHRHLCERHILVRAFDYAPNWLRFGLTADDAAALRLEKALGDWCSRRVGTL